VNRNESKLRGGDLTMPAKKKAGKKKAAKKK
jgi:hypothetical protein